MSGEFRVHTGRRKRSITAGEVESFQKRRTGSQRERNNLMQMYAPSPRCAIDGCDHPRGSACTLSGCPGRA